MRKKVITFIIVLLWLSVIYIYSNQPNLKSGFQPTWDLIFRKIAHMAEYFVLAYLVMKALWCYKLSFKQIISLALIGILAAAIFDEIHQFFIVGRNASFIDVFIDFIGGLALIILVLKERYESLFSKQSF